MDGFECSLLELDLIGASLDLDVHQFPIKLESFGAHLADRCDIAGRAHRSLTNRGLIAGDAFHPGVPRLVNLFARGRVSIAMLGATGSTVYRARAVIDGSDAVVVTQRAETIRFTSLRPGSVARTMIAALPPMRPGPGTSVTLVGEPDRRRDAMPASFLEPARPDAGHAAAERILRRRRLGTGYFVVTARADGGREGPPRTLTWLDTDAGRYAIIPSAEGNGRRNIDFTPAGRERLTQLLAHRVAIH